MRLPSWQTGLRLLSVGVIVFALLGYLRRIEQRVPLLLAPLTVPVGLETRPTLSLAPGALRGQNVVVITLDTTRPDRLGIYGNREIDTPHIDRLASEGVIFTRARATATTTLPGHASIFTGLYPIHHGGRSNGPYRVAEGVDTLAEILSAHGYRSAAFVSAFVLAEDFGLAQGFDHYDEASHRSSGYGGASERRGDETTDRAIAWLQTPHEAPFFLWVHYYDPHAEHDPPPPFDERYARLYDGEIAFVDDQIGRLLEAVDSASSRGTVVVVTADHAEAFGEHGEWSHGFLVQEATVRIPLILHASRGLPRGVHVTGPVSQIDLLPTLLAGLGLDVPAGLDGIDLADAPPGPREMVAEATQGRAYYGWARLAALYRGSLKYVEGPNPELYDLAHDPLERENLYPGRRRDAERLAAALEALEGSAPDVLEQATNALGPEDLARLQALGYAIGGGTRVAADAVVAADPKQMLPMMVRVQTLLSAYGSHPELPAWRRLTIWLSGQPFIATRADLIRALEALAREHPDFAPTWGYLAEAYREEGRLDDALRAERRARRSP